MTNQVNLECRERYTLQPYPQRMGNLSIDSGVVRLIQEWIREQGANGVTQDAMRKQLGNVSRTTIINIRDSAKGAGPKVEQAFARLKFGGSVDALRRAARGEPASREVVRVVDDRYASRGNAATAANALGYHPDAIEHVMTMRLEDDEDPGAEFWLDLMRSSDRKIRKGIPL